jgi:hypothetical protein
MVNLKAVAIAAVCWGPSRIDIFRTGFNSDLQHAWYAGVWSGWESLGGIITTVPKVTSWQSNRLDIVATGTNYAAYHKWVRNQISAKCILHIYWHKITK